MRYLFYLKIIIISTNISISGSFLGVGGGGGRCVLTSLKRTDKSGIREDGEKINSLILFLSFVSFII